MNVKYWRLQPAFFKKERIKSQLLKEERKCILQMEYSWFRKSFFFLLTSFFLNVCFISHHTTGTILHRIKKTFPPILPKIFHIENCFTYIFRGSCVYYMRLQWPGFDKRTSCPLSFRVGLYKICVLLDNIIIIIRHELGFDRPVSPRLIFCYWYVPTLHAGYTERSRHSQP